MRSQKKDCFIVLIMLFMVGYALGQTEVKIKGKFLIPKAVEGERGYIGAITFTRNGIEIECQEKIFQLFNEFDAPKHRKLEIKLGEFIDIEIMGETKKIIIHMPNMHILKDRKKSLYLRYRNMFFHFYVPITVSFDPGYHVDYGLEFMIDNPDDIGVSEKKFFRALVNRSLKVLKANSWLLEFFK